MDDSASDAAPMPMPAEAAADADTVEALSLSAMDDSASDAAPMPMPAEAAPAPADADVPDDDTATPDAPPSSLFGEFVDLRLRQDEAEVETADVMPSLRPSFAFLEMEPPAADAAPTSLLARDAGPLSAAEEPSWRTAFAAGEPPVTRVLDAATLPPTDELAAAEDDDERTATDRFEAAANVEPPAPSAVEGAPEPEPQHESVPEIVIVDGGEDGDALEALIPESPSVPEPSDALPDVTHEVALDVPSSDGGDEEVESAATLSSDAAPARKKRRRSRRRKLTVALPVEVRPNLAAPQAVVEVEPAPSPAESLAPVVSTPDVVMQPSPAEPADAPEPTLLGGRRSLLEREVPTWTPPADLGAVARVVAPRPTPVVVIPPEVVSPDQWGTGTFPVATADSATAQPASSPAARPPVERPARHAMPVPVEPPRVEEPIRAVGMPDLEEFGLSSGRGALTSVADPIGPSLSSSRHAEARPAPVIVESESSRSWTWRRVVAASVLIALFNGAAFAAWWWVQPGARGTLVVQTAQPGVEVLLDGKLLGKTPFREQVTPGRHKLTLRQGLARREMPVEISLGVVTTQALDWPAADGSARGNLQVSSTPAGAEIVIDGKSRGQAPQLLEDLPVGNLELTLRGDAGTVTVTATVIAGETTPLEVPIFAGWVLVDAPLELAIVLRGSRIGASTDGQILLSPGRHQLEAVNEALGFRKAFGVLIEPGEVRRVEITVPPGSLQVHDEAGSEVFVDGERAGVLPGLLRVPLGTHDVLVRRPDQSERRQTVTVRAGGTVSM